MTGGEDGTSSEAQPRNERRGDARAPFYVRLSVEIPAHSEEQASVVLWDLGSRGSEVLDAGPDRLLIRAYFAGEAREAVGAAALALADLGAERVSLARVGTEDWQASYREVAQPAAVSERFLIDPREPGKTLPDAPDRFVLRLPARRAFGTGSHPSTELALRLLETSHVVDQRVLDVGYGTGVLAFAALLLGARTAIGVEKSLEAALVGGENRKLNRLEPGLLAGEIDAIRPGTRFDLIVANLLSHRLFPLLPRVAPLLAADGVLILSGFLGSECGEVVERLQAVGLGEQRKLQQDEWAALAVGHEG